MFGDESFNQSVIQSVSQPFEHPPVAQRGAASAPPGTPRGLRVTTASMMVHWGGCCFVSPGSLAPSLMNIPALKRQLPQKYSPFNPFNTTPIPPFTSTTATHRTSTHGSDRNRACPHALCHPRRRPCHPPRAPCHPRRAPARLPAAASPPRLAAASRDRGSKPAPGRSCRGLGFWSGFRV